MATVKADQPSDEAFAGAAWLLRCEVAAVRAVAAVESGAEGAFLDTGEPVILFEPHVFHRETGGKFDGRRVGLLDDRTMLPKSVKWGELSYPKWRRGWYGPARVQHRRLHSAVLLSKTAALRSCSWGLFQLMGFNHEACGYPILQRFVNAMYRGVDDHLVAFTQYIRRHGRMVDALRALDWRAFARAYNGSGYERNAYHTKMAEAYRRARAEG